MTFSDKNLNHSDIASPENLNNCLPAIIDMADSNNPYVNEMTLPLDFVRPVTKPKLSEMTKKVKFQPPINKE